MSHLTLKLYRLPVAVLFLLLWVAAPGASASSGQGRIDWQPFAPAAFAQARAEGKLVLLDLVAVWCHWCHVMDAETYADPVVAAYIARHYVPVKADHDARPDLAERYRDWGWPATVVLNADGEDVVKRAGYISRDAMLRMLAAVVADPSPEDDPAVAVPTQIAEDGRLDAALAETLRARHVAAYDRVEGGLDSAMKFLDQDSVLWSLRLAAEGDAAEAPRARHVLDANQALIDPAFGGVYQYSTHGDWVHPHFEKIMKTQWANLLIYSRACTQFDEPSYCAAGRRVAAFLTEFLSDADGAFYSSQDADLVQGTKGHDYFALDREARLAQGLPRIDKSRYAATNGMAIEGLVELYLATNDAAYLERARRAADWVVANRRLWGGGFRHDRIDAAGPYLADTLWMGRAFLALYRATGEEAWLTRSRQAAAFIGGNLRDPRAGVVASADDGTPLKPSPQIDQNIQTALWLAELAEALAEAPTGSVEAQHAAEPLALARHVMRYLAAPSVATARFTEAGILEVDARLRAVESRMAHAGG
ncbi:MAG: thioredoxin domain-containing protein [Gammaproteobacteria bacterium]|nr:thioredoxin domain-containing protein [Gammaproteobacteria bacterium]